LRRRRRSEIEFFGERKKEKKNEAGEVAGKTRTNKLPIRQYEYIGVCQMYILQPWTQVRALSVYHHLGGWREGTNAAVLTEIK
jgi:hypothetical protein